jgi:hypothetical protein
VQHHDLESLISQSEAREAELAQLVCALLMRRRAYANAYLTFVLEKRLLGHGFIQFRSIR